MTKQDRAASDFRTAEEWQIKYQVVTAYIDNPAVIENAERAAAWVLQQASATRYSLAEVTAMFGEILRWIWQDEQAGRLSAQSAKGLIDQLTEAADDPAPK